MAIVIHLGDHLFSNQLEQGFGLVCNPPLESEFYHQSMQR
jgi:hypothetical protein